MPRRPAERRVTTAVRIPPDVHEALKETADELGVGLNWLVNRFCVEGLERMDLTHFTLLRNSGH